MRSARTAGPGDAMAHPASLLALAALLVNDHWAKAHFAGVFTGKLSDIAGLALAPALLVATAELLSRRALSPVRAMTVAALAVGVTFALTKTLAPAAHAYRALFGALRYPLDALAALLAGRSLPTAHAAVFARDPTDLLALPALLVPLTIARQHERRSEPVEARATQT